VQSCSTRSLWVLNCCLSDPRAVFTYQLSSNDQCRFQAMIKPCQKKWLSIKRETGNDAPFNELSPFYFGSGQMMVGHKNECAIPTSSLTFLSCPSSENSLSHHPRIRRSGLLTSDHTAPICMASDTNATSCRLSGSARDEADEQHVNFFSVKAY
jgi:hypothetical protein